MCLLLFFDQPLHHDSKSLQLTFLSLKGLYTPLRYEDRSWVNVGVVHLFSPTSYFNTAVLYPTGVLVVCAGNVPSVPQNSGFDAFS